MLRDTVEQTQYERVRQPIKRKAVNVLRSLVDAVPELGDVTTFLKSDRRAQDAVFTLNAMSFKPNLIATFVSRERLTERVVLDILASSVTRKLLHILRSVN